MVFSIKRNVRTISPHITWKHAQMNNGFHAGLQVWIFIQFIWFHAWGFSHSITVSHCLITWHLLLKKKKKKTRKKQKQQNPFSSIIPSIRRVEIWITNPVYSFLSPSLFFPIHTHTLTQTHPQFLCLCLSDSPFFLSVFLSLFLGYIPMTFQSPVRNVKK